jgi:hypothetical protein
VGWLPFAGLARLGSSRGRVKAVGSRETVQLGCDPEGSAAMPRRIRRDSPLRRPWVPKRFDPARCAGKTGTVCWSERPEARRIGGRSWRLWTRKSSAPLSTRLASRGGLVRSRASPRIGNAPPSWSFLRKSTRGSSSFVPSRTRTRCAKDPKSATAFRPSRSAAGILPDLSSKRRLGRFVFRQRSAP